MLTAKVSTSRTVSCMSTPSSSGTFRTRARMLTAGIVRPMVASEEPRARLRLFCSSLRRAAHSAATVSGSSTSNATRSPTDSTGAPIAETTAPIEPATLLASSTTATKPTSSMATLSRTCRVPGAASWSPPRTRSDRK
jgi:hypothetical protein